MGRESNPISCQAFQTEPEVKGRLGSLAQLVSVLSFSPHYLSVEADHVCGITMYLTFSQHLTVSDLMAVSYLIFVKRLSK